MGFFGFIGEILNGIFEIGKKLMSFVKRVFTGQQTVVEYNPNATMYCYSDNTCNTNRNYHRDEFRWENDCTDPTNINNANNQEARRRQYQAAVARTMPVYPQNYQYANPVYNQYRVPYTNGVNSGYGYGYVNQNQVMTRPMPYQNTAHTMTYPPSPYDVQVQNMRHQYSNQELKWKMTPEILRQINGPSNWVNPLKTNPGYSSFNYSQLYGKSTTPVSQTSSGFTSMVSTPQTTQSYDKDDWSTIKWTSDLIKKNDTPAPKPNVTPLTPPTDDGVVCAFGRKPDNYVGNVV